jgi:hypothetical protein
MLAVMEELSQLHIMDTWKAMDPTKLSQEEHMWALSSLLILKEKRTGKVKGQACLNGVPQRSCISKEEAALPHVSMESTFITALIAASKRKAVQCYNMPSAFVNTDVHKDVLMVLKGKLMDMTVKLHHRSTEDKLPWTEREQGSSM